MATISLRSLPTQLGLAVLGGILLGVPGGCGAHSAYLAVRPPSVTAPDFLRVTPGLPAPLTVSASGTLYWHQATEDIVLFETLKGPVVWGSKPGTHYLYAYAVRGGRSTPLHAITILVEGAPPDPGPKPPDPGPKPPDPIPPSPITGPRVLVVYETDDATKLTEGQRQFLYGRASYDLLDRLCGKDPTAASGKAWRIWDKDQVLLDVSKEWKEAMARPRKSIPWIQIYGPRGAYEGPLPSTLDESMALVRKLLESS